MKPRLQILSLLFVIMVVAPAVIWDPIDQPARAESPAHADLELTITVDDAAPRLGDTVTFTIAVTHSTGASDATNVLIYHRLSPGLLFQNQETSQGKYDPESSLWHVEVLEVGHEAKLKLMATVSRPGRVVTSAEIIASDQPDPDSTPSNGNPHEDDQDEAILSAILRSSSRNAHKLGPLLREIRNSGESTSNGAQSLAGGPASSGQPGARVSDGKVLIDFVAESGDGSALLGELRSLGLEDGVAFSRIVSGWLPIEKVADLEDTATLRYASASQATTMSGSVTSQGSQALAASLARASYSVDGGGLSIGVLSDTFDCLGGAAADIASGDLPTGIVVLDEGTCGSSALDEGRAMMQLIYDVAPGVNFIFHEAFGGQAAFAQGIVDLAAAGADIIVDDVIYFAEPMFQDGPIAQAVDTVVQSGVPYFSAAGNSGSLGYESGFVDGGAHSYTNFFGTTNYRAHDFDPGPGVDIYQKLTIAGGATIRIAFQWDEPFFSVSGAPGSSNDLDLVLYNSDLSQGVQAAQGPNLGGDAREVLSFYNDGPTAEFNLLIGKEAAIGGPDPGSMKYVIFGNATIEEYDAQSGTTFGHANAVGASAVGAVYYQDTPAYGTTPPTLQPYSSGGTTPILFGTDGTRLGTPSVRPKPSVVGPDGTDTTFFGGVDPDSNGFPNFFGTSAAAPHVAGVAALLLDARSSLSPSEVYDALQSTAIDMDAAGYDNDSGYGFVQAHDAVEFVMTADLELVKTVDNTAPLIGQTVTFTVAVGNSTDSVDATNVEVTDQLPSGLTYATHSADQGTFNSGTGVWTIGTITPGATVTLDITATVTAEGLITNVAEVTASERNDPDSTPDNNTLIEDDQDAVSITAIGEADLSLTKSVSDTIVQVGDIVTFTLAILVGATGSADATNVEVTDSLPSGLTFISSTPSQGTYNSSTGVWAVGTVPLGSSATLYISAKVTADGLITNGAEVTAVDQFDPDSTAGNGLLVEDDEDEASLTANHWVDLDLTKTVSEASPLVDDLITFTLTVTNATGSTDATGVTVTDLLPAGLAYSSDTASQGTYNSGTGVWTVGSVALGATATLDLEAVVVSDGAISNDASITAVDQNDNNPSNDDASAGITASHFADLELTKTVNKATPFIDESVTFTLSLFNASSSTDATNVEVTDQLPTGVTYSTHTADQGSYDSGTGVWTVGTLPFSATATLDIVVTVTAEGVFTNDAEVTGSDQVDPDSTPNNDEPSEDDQDSASVTGIGEADLSISKTVDDATVLVGDSVTFTILVTNTTGTADATSVVVSDPLPAEFSYTGHSASQGSYDSGTGAWSVGTLVIGATASLDVAAKLVGPGEFSNSATVASLDQIDPNSENDGDAASVTAEDWADLSIAKSVDEATPFVNDTVTFTIVVTNATGSADATSITVTDQLPSGVTSATHSADQGTYNDSTGTWTVGTVAVDGTATLTVTGTVDAEGFITNSASISALDQVDPNSSNDSDSASITATGEADLSITKSVNDASPLVEDSITFSLLLSNASSTVDATDIEVTDLLPSDLTYVSHSASQGTYTNGTGVWSVGTLIEGATATLDITATVTAEGLITNNASVTGLDQVDPDSGNDSDSASVTASGEADLSITKSVDDVSPLVGDTVTFSLLLSNDSSTVDATGIEITDLLPSGLTYVSDSASQGTYNDGTAVWDVGTLIEGATATLDITATVTANGLITNDAAVTGLDQIDPVSGNDNDSASVTASHWADLELTKDVNAATPLVGDSVTFTLTLTHTTGSADATGVAITDLLPSGLSYTSHSASQGTYNDGTGAWSVGTLAQGATATLDITATVTGDGLITNNATVSALDQVDPSSGNDSDSASITASHWVDLSLAKTVNDGTPLVEDVVTFTVVVTNTTGSADATNVAVSDLLPAGLSYATHSVDEGAYNGGTGAWSIGTLLLGASATLDILATVTAEGLITNDASITGLDQVDISSANDSDSASVTAIGEADLSVTKSVDDGSPLVGDTVVFTVVLSNDSSTVDATGITISDLLPAGVSYASHSVDQGTYDGGTGVWSVGTLSESATATLDISAVVTASGLITNDASVSGLDQIDPVSGNDSDSASITASHWVDLGISKAVNDASPFVDDVITFTITLTNTTGSTDATNVAVADLLPTGVSYATHSTDQGSYNNGTGAWSVGTLSLGGSATLTIGATVTAEGLITSDAAITSVDQLDVDSDNDSDSASITATGEADLSIAKSVDNATPLVGDTVTFTILVTNTNSTVDATNITVTDLLPAGLSYTSHSASQGTYNDATGTWSVGTLANGATAALDISAIVTTDGLILNTATVDQLDQVDSNSGNDSDSASITASHWVDLSLAKSVDSTNPLVGDSVTFTLVVTNTTGSTDATNVTLSDLIPAEVNYNSHTVDVGTYDGGTGLWTIGTLVLGASATLDVVTTVAADGLITNTASIASVDQVDNNSGNDGDSASITASHWADLSLTKAVNDAAPLVGDTITFTIIVTNTAGSNDATGVTVSDLLPAGVSYATYSADQGSYSNGTGTWNVGTIVPGATASLDVSAVVTAEGFITNNASISGLEEVDPNSGNDSDSASITAIGEADLELTLTVDEPLPLVGDAVVFTIVLTNATGTVDATNVSVTDLLPPGLSYSTSTADQGTYDNNTGVWAVGMVPLNSSVTLDITATVLSAGAHVNFAEVTAADQADPDSTPNNGQSSEDDLATVSLAPSATTNFIPVFEDDEYEVTVTGSYPIPTVYSVTPNSISQGSGAQVITITGVNFLDGAVVLWNGSPRATTFVSSTQVTASVSDADVAATNEGLVSVRVTVVNPSPTAGPSDAANVLLIPGELGTIESDSAGVGSSVSVSTLPADTDEPGVTATVINATDSDDADVLVTVGTYTSDPTTTNTFDVGGGYVDVNVAGADANDVLETFFYYPASSTGDSESALLTYYTGPEWAYVRSSGDTGPVKDTTNNLDGTISGGRFTVVFDDTSTPLLTDLTGTVFTSMQPADLSVAISDSPDPVTAGSNLTYSITVANAGPSGSNDTALVFDLPGGVDFVSASSESGSCSENSGTVTCAIGVVTAGGNVVVTVVVTPPNEATLNASASVSTSQPESDTSNNGASVSTSVQAEAPPPSSSGGGGFFFGGGGSSSPSPTPVSAPEPTARLWVSIYDWGPTITAGAEKVFRAEITNIGDADATDVEVSLLLPSNVEFMTSDKGCVVENGVVRCDRFSLAPRDDATFRFMVKAAPDAQVGWVLPATVSAVSAELTTDNNMTTQQNAAVEASSDLGIEIDVTPGPIVAGSTIDVGFTARNLGPSDASRVTLTATLPEEISVSTLPTACEADGQTVSCSLNSLPAGAERRFDLTAVVLFVQENQVTLTVAGEVAAAQPDPETDNNTATASLEVVTETDLSVSVSGWSAQLLTGDQVTYVLLATNNGELEATDLVLTSTLANQLTIVTTGTDCTASAGVVTCAINSLAPGAVWQASFTVIAGTDPTDGAQLLNEVRLSSSLPDRDGSDNVVQLNGAVNAPQQPQTAPTPTPEPDATAVPNPTPTPTAAPTATPTSEQQSEDEDSGGWGCNRSSSGNGDAAALDLVLAGLLFTGFGVWQRIRRRHDGNR